MGVIHHLTRQGGRRLEKGQLVKRLSQNHPLKWITKAEKIPLTDLLIFYRTWRVYNCFQEFGNSSTFLSDKIRHVNMGSWHLFARFFFHKIIFSQFLFKIYLTFWRHRIFCELEYIFLLWMCYRKFPLIRENEHLFKSFKKAHKTNIKISETGFRLGRLYKTIFELNFSLNGHMASLSLFGSKLKIGRRNVTIDVTKRQESNKKVFLGFAVSWIRAL